jgi:uncharacterized glyoxalase superfamily protein PhnB
MAKYGSVFLSEIREEKNYPISPIPCKDNFGVRWGVNCEL